jgi:amidase
MKPSIDGYNVVDSLPNNLPPVTYPRTPGTGRVPRRNQHNAWYYKSTVQGAPAGKLKGKTIVLKDNVMLAGVPMMNGASTLEGYMPEVDATDRDPILDAGGTILGKAHCEYFCLSAAATPMPRGRCTTRTSGTTRPGAPRRAAPSSSRSARPTWPSAATRRLHSHAVVVLRDVRDEATHGLVPYTGIMPIEIYVDHTGPITANVKDNALLLEVIAGADGLDPRQYAPVVHPYTESLGKGVDGLRIAVVQEGFGHPKSERDVDEKVKKAAELLERWGRRSRRCRSPGIYLAGALWLPIGVEGLTQTMMWGDGYGPEPPRSLRHEPHGLPPRWRQRANELSETTKLFTLLGTYIHKNHGSRYYGKAMNITAS